MLVSCDSSGWCGRGNRGLPLTVGVERDPAFIGIGPLGAEFVFSRSGLDNAT